MKKISFALAVTLLGFSAFSQNTNKLLHNYIAVKNALVAGDRQAATDAAIEFRKNITEDENFALKGELLKAATTMAKAGNIDKQRAAFSEASANMWKLVKGAERLDKPVYYQYCPMKKAYWLSAEKEIENPYFGAAMLACGDLVETR